MKNNKFIWIYRIIFFLIALINFFESTRLYQLRFDLDYIYYYTNLSNFLVFIWISYEIYKLVFNVKTLKKDYMLKFDVTLIIMITFIVYNTLLGDMSSPDYYQIPNLLKHVLIPILMLVDYLVFTPKNKVMFKDTYQALAFPVLYFIYAMIRGAFTHEYPYFFVDPTDIGYIGVFVYVVAITLAIWLFSYLLYVVNKKKKI